MKGYLRDLALFASPENGDVVDSNFEKDPASFVFGDGNLPEGLSNLIGLKAGDDGEFTVLPEKAFGMHNPSNIQTFKRFEFGADITLEEGLVLSFEDAANSELPGVVKSFDDQEVLIDFNHPLAGEILTFKVAIRDVRAAEQD